MIPSVVGLLEYIAEHGLRIYNPYDVLLGRASKVSTNQTRNNFSLKLLNVGRGGFNNLMVIKDGVLNESRLRLQVDPGLMEQLPQIAELVYPNRLRIDLSKLPLIVEDDGINEYWNWKDIADDFFNTRIYRFEIKLIKFILDPVIHTKVTSVKKTKEEEEVQYVNNVILSSPGINTIPSLNELGNDSQSPAIKLLNDLWKDVFSENILKSDKGLAVKVTPEEVKLFKSELESYKDQCAKIDYKLAKYRLYRRIYTKAEGDVLDTITFNMYDTDYEIRLEWHKSKLNKD